MCSPVKLLTFLRPVCQSQQAWEEQHSIAYRITIFCRPVGPCCHCIVHIVNGVTDLHFEQACKGRVFAIVELTHCKLWQDDICARSISITYSCLLMVVDEMKREYWHSLVLTGESGIGQVSPPDFSARVRLFFRRRLSLTRNSIRSRLLLFQQNLPRKKCDVLRNVLNTP